MTFEQILSQVQTAQDNGQSISLISENDNTFSVDSETIGKSDSGYVSTTEGFIRADVITDFVIDGKAGESTKVDNRSLLNRLIKRDSASDNPREALRILIESNGRS